MVSALHQRFCTSFTVELLTNLLHGIANPPKSYLITLSDDAREKEDAIRLPRQRILQRILTELWIVGVFRTVLDIPSPQDLPPFAIKNTKKGFVEPIAVSCLKETLGYEVNTGYGLPIANMFVKVFGVDVLGVENKNESDDPDAAKPKERPLVLVEYQTHFRVIFNAYIKQLIKMMKVLNTEIVKQRKNNERAFIKAGKVLEDLQTKYETNVRLFEKLENGCKPICDTLGIELPVFINDDEDEDEPTGTIIRKDSIARSDTEEEKGIWDNIEQRKFYEDLIDLAERVPETLLANDKKQDESNQAELADQLQAELEKEEELEPEKSKDNNKDTTDVSKSNAPESAGTKMELFLIKLKDAQSREAVDECAIQYCLLHNSASINRIIKFLILSPLSEQYMLPYYSRFVATVSRYFPRIKQELISNLDREFKSQFYKGERAKGHYRLRNLKYLSELTKFGIVENIIIFNKIRKFIMDLKTVNIEALSLLLDGCGRYLFLNPSTHDIMVEMLDLLNKKRRTKDLSVQDKMILQGCYLYIDPPKAVARVKREQPLIEQFIRKLFYKDLTPDNGKYVMNLIGKLDWDDADTIRTLKINFTKIWRIKYGNVRNVVFFLKQIYSHHNDFVIYVIDDLFESIRRNLELNTFKFNQQRVTQVQYLGLLFQYDLINPDVMFETLYLLITFGHPDNRPTPGQYTRLDPPSDFFRIRLVCSILEVCSSKMAKVLPKKKLDLYLAFFQFYLFTKDELSMDIEFAISDLFNAVRPNWKRAENIQEAAKQVKMQMKRSLKVNASDSTGSKSQDQNNSVDPNGGDSGDEGEDQEEEEEEEDDGKDDGNSDEEREAILAMEEHARLEEARILMEEKKKLDDELDKEFQKLLMESNDPKKADVTSSKVEAVIPTRQMFKSLATSDEQEPPTDSKGNVKFTLITRQGRGQQTRLVSLPNSSEIVQSVLKVKDEQLKEKKRIKNIVLKLEKQQQIDETEIDDDITKDKAYDITQKVFSPRRL